jgi:hypothetical protein
MRLVDANRKYFEYMETPFSDRNNALIRNSHIANAYDEKPWFAKVNELLTSDLRDRLNWVGIPFVNTDSKSDAEDVRLLDYACGTGGLSRV